ERDHPEQVVAVALGIRVGLLADPGSLLAHPDAFQLPDEVAHKRVAPPGGQRHEDNYAAGRVTVPGDHNDPAMPVDLVAGRKAEVRTPFEPMLLIPYAGKEFAKIHAATLPDNLAFLWRHPHRHAWKVGQAANVVPVRMGQKNGTERFLVVASSPELVGG